MRVRLFATVLVIAITAVASSACSAAAFHNKFMQHRSDPISGEWTGSFAVQETTMPFTFKFKLDGGKITGTGESAHTGPGTISNGSWADNKLSCTMDFASHESIAITATLRDGKLVGEYRTEGRQGAWEAKKK